MQEHEENGFDDFSDRFRALADEAEKYGIIACVVLLNENPISGSAGLVSMHRGGRVRAIGMFQQALWHLEKSI